MAANVVVDSGFLVALVKRQDRHHDWAAALALRHPPPWFTCEAALTEAFFLLAARGPQDLGPMLTRRAVISKFDLESNVQPIINLMRKYSDVSMSFADACLVRMTEMLTDSLLLTPDSDFHIYRRNNRQVVPCISPT